MSWLAIRHPCSLVEADSSEKPNGKKIGYLERIFSIQVLSVVYEDHDDRDDGDDVSAMFFLVVIDRFSSFVRLFVRSIVLRFELGR